jgi:diguanylate cyclase (GGDEF)-like protein
MANSLEPQLDFIFFFYGLAFILLGVLCLFIARAQGAGSGTVRLIGLFGCVHGTSEWLDMMALVIGDSAEFAILRAAVLTISYVFIAEAARQYGLKFNVPVPGIWIYLPVLLLICAVGVVDGVPSAKAVARYLLGATGAFGVGVSIFLRRGEHLEAARPLLSWVAVGFVIYAMATGVFVERAPFWPAVIVNQDSFEAVTGVPIQLVRGVIAVVLAALIWGAWGNLLMETFDSPRYSAYLKRQFVGVLATLIGILALGWVLTNVLGGIYRENVQTEASGDVDLLVSRFSRETAIADAMVKALAGAPSVLRLLMGGDDASRDVAQSVLDLDVNAVGATRGWIVDRSGDVVVASTGRDVSWLAATPNRRGTAWFAQSIEGRPASELMLDPITTERSYLTSHPIRGKDGAIAGVAVLETSLEPLATTLSRFDQVFFIVDRSGVVQMTNRPDELQRTLWPRADVAPMQLAERLGAPKRPPLLGREIFGGEWINFDGRRSYVLRQPIDDNSWSLILVIPVRGIFASRLLGIIVTLQLAIAALFYFFGRDRGARERAERTRREELQHQTLDLARQAATDALTGLANRLKFNQRLEEELARSQRSGRPFSLIFYDIDHFKEINDVYGHPMGDQVLVRLSQTVAANVRQTDLLARWGGEEFVVLLVDTDAVAACEIAEKLRLLVAHTIFDQVGTVTSSFGVAQYCPDDTAETLLARTDNAVYRAKLNGRNRVALSVPVVEAAELSPAV